MGGILCIIFLPLPIAAESLSRLRLEESTDLQNWQSIAVTPEMIDANGSLVLPTDGAERFYRMQFELIQPPGLSAQPAPATVASGSGTTLSVTASGTGPFTYQWYQGAVGTTTTPVGTNSASFATPALSETTTYWVRITNPAGSVDSGLATVTVATAPSITTQPVSTTISSGQTATLTVSASGTAPLTYQWYQGTVGTTTTPVGTNSASFTTSALTATTTYWVRVSNVVGSVDSVLATTTTTTGGSIPADMALIPAGSFTMGDTLRDGAGVAGGGDTPHTVFVSEFYMGKHEVTKSQWDEVKSWAISKGYEFSVDSGNGKAHNHPVYGIRWNDAVKWCNARSEKEGLTPVYRDGSKIHKTGISGIPSDVLWYANGYRLPTEAEWEKAARGGLSGKRFPWGSDTISHLQANYKASDVWSYDSSGSVNNFHPTYATGSQPYTSPVGSFAPNDYGIYDMAGNLSEWCWDTYGYDYETTDPRGSPYGSSRIFRGGSWAEVAWRCRVAGYNDSYPEVTSIYVGFRVARGSVQ